MRKCKDCAAPYRLWKPSVFAREINSDIAAEVEIPTCHCLRNKSELAYQQHLNEEERLRAVERFQRLKFENPDLPPAGIEVPKGLWADPVAEVKAGNKFVISGPTGSTKTLVLKVICLKLCLAGVKVRGGYLQWVLDSLKNMDEVGERMEHLMSGHVLVLDDLDKPTMTKYELDRLMSFVNYYDAPGRSILVSMNSSYEGLRAKLGASGSDELTKNKAAAFLSRLYNHAVVVEQSKTTPDLREPGEVHHV